MSASIALQKDVSIAYLGPQGTFSHQAAYNRFGDSVAYVAQKQISGKKKKKKKNTRLFILIAYVLLDP